MFRCLFNAVRWLVNAFSWGEEQETPRGQNEQFNYSHVEIQATQAHLSELEIQSGKGRNKTHDYLFNNKWRKKAKEKGQLMKKFYKKATLAWKEGNHKTSKDYAKEAKKHRKNRDIAKKETVKWVLANNDTDFSNNRVDLHGLKVVEALEVVKKCLKTPENKDCDEYRIITGWGKGSKNQKPKIKPRVIQYLEKNFRYEVDVDNQGLIMVYF